MAWVVAEFFRARQSREPIARRRRRPFLDCALCDASRKKRYGIASGGREWRQPKPAMKIANNLEKAADAALEALARVPRAQAARRLCSTDCPRAKRTVSEPDAPHMFLWITIALYRHGDPALVELAQIVAC
jgi:hypothetical protein